MIRELDVVKLKQSLSVTDIEGEEVRLRAGTRGTVIVSKPRVSVCIVEFGGKELGNETMVTVNRKDLKLVWSYKKQSSKKFDGLKSTDEIEKKGYLGSKTTTKFSKKMLSKDAKD
jgi:hypothetical protein